MNVKPELVLITEPDPAPDAPGLTGHYHPAVPKRCKDSPSTLLNYYLRNTFYSLACI